MSMQSCDRPDTDHLIRSPFQDIWKSAFIPLYGTLLRPPLKNKPPRIHDGLRGYPCKVEKDWPLATVMCIVNKITLILFPHHGIARKYFQEKNWKHLSLNIRFPNFSPHHLPPSIHTLVLTFL